MLRNGLTVNDYKKIMSSYATLNTSWIVLMCGTSGNERLRSQFPQVSTDTPTCIAAVTWDQFLDALNIFSVYFMGYLLSDV